MSVLIICGLIALFDLFHPRADLRERGLSGWYAMRSFTHPFQVLIYGAIVWVGPPLTGYILWSLTA